MATAGASHCGDKALILLLVILVIVSNNCYHGFRDDETLHLTQNVKNIWIWGLMYSLLLIPLSICLLNVKLQLEDS